MKRNIFWLVQAFSYSCKKAESEKNKQEIVVLGNELTTATEFNISQLNLALYQLSLLYFILCDDSL